MEIQYVTLSFVVVFLLILPRYSTQTHDVFILNLVLILLHLKVQGDRCGGQSRLWMINLIYRYKNRARTKSPDDPCLTGFCSGHRTRSKVRDFHLKDLKTTPTADRRLLHRKCSIKIDS